MLCSLVHQSQGLATLQLQAAADADAQLTQLQQADYMFVRRHCRQQQQQQSPGTRENLPVDGCMGPLQLYAASQVEAAAHHVLTGQHMCTAAGSAHPTVRVTPRPAACAQSDMLASGSRQAGHTDDIAAQPDASSDMVFTTSSNASRAPSFRGRPPAPLKSGTHLLDAVDIDGLPVPGPLTASLAALSARRAAAEGSLKVQHRVAQLPVGSRKPIPKAAGCSILDSTAGSLRQSSSSTSSHAACSSAAAHHSIAAAAAASTVSKPAERQGAAAMQLLAAKAPPGSFWRQHKTHKPASRLQAASFPADGHCTSVMSKQVPASTSAGAASVSGGLPLATECSSLLSADFKAGRACAGKTSMISNHQPSSSAAVQGQNSTRHTSKDLSQDGMAASACISSELLSSVGSTGPSSPAGGAGLLKGSRLRLWQGQPSAQAQQPAFQRWTGAGCRQLGVSEELPGGSTGTPSDTSVPEPAVRQQRTGAVQGSTAGSPRVRFFSPCEPSSSMSCEEADVFDTPEAAECSSNSSRSSTAGSSPDSLADTAQSALSYALPAHMMLLVRGTPFVSLAGTNHDYIE